MRCVLCGGEVGGADADLLTEDAHKILSDGYDGLQIQLSERQWRSVRRKAQLIAGLTGAESYRVMNELIHNVIGY